ncbi:MAG: HAMP domain-containing sensor histidine kinase [Candidatus Omnitrophica bacterium]|nr:HAMP domain-containing sensor histidine kinase [Candidatus Omnitrophota bacterium]
MNTEKISPISDLRSLFFRSLRMRWLEDSALATQKRARRREFNSIPSISVGSSEEKSSGDEDGPACEHSIESLNRFAASIGHEINNPLTILSMNISRIILQYRKDNNLRVKDVLEHFERMENNIARIKAVVNTLTHLLHRTGHSRMRPLELRKLVDDTIPLCQFQTYLDHFSKVEFKNDVPENLPLVRGDRERLQEVFLNLFVNAYRALLGKKNGQIRVSASIYGSDANGVRVEVTDNGCGMDDETLRKVFTYGFTTKPKGKGSGIGLYLCRYIVHLGGGEIKVKSKKSEGTTFTILLPVYRKDLPDEKTHRELVGTGLFTPKL